MPYFDPKRQTKKVDLSDGYWVLFRHILVEESRALSDDKDNADRGMDGMLNAILDWNLDDVDGQKAPIDRAHLDKMPQGDFAKLAEAFAEFEGVKPDARFPGLDGAGDTGRVAGAASPAEIPGASGVLATSGA